MKIFLAACLVALTTGCQQLQQLPSIPKGTVGVTVTYTIAGDEKPVTDFKSDPKPD